MGQQEVIDILKKVGKPLSRSEIAKLLDWDPNKTSQVIARVIKDKFNPVKFKEVDRVQALKIYGCKRRLKIYFYCEN